ncbi:MAG: glycoside hydrolase family 95 protein [Bacteroidetes bacterium]|nr:glycoside hydrolase family 95 protein [Bacteroidota bacterium]
MRFLFLVIFTFVIAQYSNVQGQTSNSLWYEKPAEKWLEALPIGNGSIGAMIFGGVDKERIQFNEQSLCTGDQEKMGNYQPFGDIYIDFASHKASGYRRELNINEAIHKTTFEANGVHFKREYFASYPDKVIVFFISADKKNQISGKVKLADAHHALITTTAQKLIATGRLTENQMDYESQIQVINNGGIVTTDTSGITVTNANTVTILLSAGTSFINDFRKDFKGDHPHQRLEKILSAASKKTYEQLLKNHESDYHALFNRVQLNLGNTPNESTLDRLKAYKKGAKDPALEALLFQYGRYLLISSSRPGGLPANLQGIWNDEFKPAWYSQYTTNINIEMNYWLAEPTGLTECTAPLFDWVENLADVQKKSSDPKLITKKGWIAYSTNNIMGGNSKWGIHRPGSAWLSQHFWEHYAFTGDTNFLKNRAYPMLKDVVEYWEEHLIERPDGKLITPDGWSPEHAPGMIEGDRTPYPGVSYDQQIVYDLFSNYIEASKALNIDTDYRTKITEMRNKLLGPQIGKWGQLQEWMEDVDNPQDHHRHNSHMFAVHPGRQISPISTPEYAKAALVSLNARGDEGGGWSSAWKINIYARLLEPKKAYKFIHQLINRNILLNLFDTYPPFQMDGNFGFTAGVTEMLLQSHLKNGDTNIIQLLPALPTAWLNGSITGLKTRGGITTNIYWKNGKLIKAEFKSNKDDIFEILYDTTKEKINIQANKKYKFYPKYSK